MIINHNMNAMNAHRMMMGNVTKSGKAMEKLSSGLRINRAGDDAAGLAISEKMRGQIRGLDQATRNSQDGISMLQTAEGSLNETHSILQRMKELATQASNDTNVGVDRKEIQKEMNQLSSEINRIGNTTEFNTKSLLKGDGQTNLNNTGLVTAGKLANGTDATTTEAVQKSTIATAAVDNDTLAYTINGQTLTMTFSKNTTIGTTTSKLDASTVTANAATIGTNSGSATSDAAAIIDAMNAMIEKNTTLKGNFKVVAGAAAGDFEIQALSTGDFKGAAGNISAGTAGATSGTATLKVTGAADTGANNPAGAASKVVSFKNLTGAAGADTDVNIKKLVGTGMTINGQQIEFYNSNDGAYTGNAIGVNISTALATTQTSGKDEKVEELVKNIAQQVGSKIDGVTLQQGGATHLNELNINASVAGAAGNNIEVSDGGIQKSFEATLQVGANQGQGFKIDINDMRAAALSVTGVAGKDATEGAKFTTTNTVTNGTDSTTREAALDVSDYKNATAAIKVINNAIENVSSERSKLGAFQNRLEHTINNLGTSSENLQSAESRVRDVDMAKEMMNFSKNNILSQASQAMLAQAKSQPEGVLQLLR
ncbi:hypothetical protein UT300005_34800 [Clostridium sp. CTA-5]